MDEMSIIHGALERADAVERAAFVAAACGSDPELLERIEVLLAAHERAGDFLVWEPCLRKEPSRRYGSAAEVAADLERWLGGHPILARPVSRAEQTCRWVRRNPLTASLSLVTLLSVLALAVISSIAYVRTARSLAESDQRLYANQLMLASRELDARHRNQALWLLRETGQSHRGWEWHYRPVTWDW